MRPDRPRRRPRSPRRSSSPGAGGPGFPHGSSGSGLRTCVAPLKKKTGGRRPPARESSPERVTRLLLHRGLDRILDVLDLVERDVAQVAADLLDLADIDRLDDVAGLRIDRDRAARAL